MWLRILQAKKGDVALEPELGPEVHQRQNFGIAQGSGLHVAPHGPYAWCLCVVGGQVAKNPVSRPTLDRPDLDQGYS